MAVTMTGRAARMPIGTAAGAIAYLFPGAIWPIMETARSTALAASVVKTAIRWAVLSASQPFMPAGITPTATTQRKIIAHANRKKREGAKGRTG